VSADLDRLLDEPPERPRLIMAPDDWERLMGWALATDSETSGMGLLSADGADLRVARLFLLPQAGNEVETELDPAALAGLVGELVDDGIDPGGLRLWWHSHARETPFWSGLDEHTIESFGPVSMVSLVVDHRSRHLARLDRFEPRRAVHWVTLHVDRGGAIEEVRPTAVRRRSTAPGPTEAAPGLPGAPGDDVGRVVRRLGGQAGLRAGGGH
jgi:hypothetical protein